MKNKLKTLLKTISSSVIATSVAIPVFTLSSCAKERKQNFNNEQPNGINGSDNSIGYYYVTFEAGDFPGVKFVGETNVKIRENSFFAEVATPTATCGGLRFKWWSTKTEKDDDGEWKKISPSLRITKDLKVYPIFEQQILLSNCVGFTAIEKTAITVISFQGSTQVDTIPQDLHYTLNYGDDHWPSINEKTDHTIVLEPGENVFFKGKGLPTGETGVYSGFNKGHYPDADSITTIFAFSGFDGEDGAVNMGGSIMGLIDDGLGNIPDIPTEHCFANVFYDDTAEETFKPAIKYVSSTFLPSLTLQPYCYDSLFQNHNTLLAAPELPATTLANYCYNNLYSYCSLLDYIKIAYTGLFYDTFTLGWVDHVASTGKIIYDGDETTHSSSCLPVGWTVEKSPTEDSEVTVTCPDTKDMPADYEYVDNHPYKFEATVSGEGVSQDVTWVSTNTAVASVNPSSGEVTGISPGECDIVAYSKVDYSKYGSKHIKIRNVEVDDCMIVTCNEASSMSWEYVGAGTIPSFSYSYDGKDWFVFWYGNAVSLAKGQTVYIKGNNPSGLCNGTSASYTHITFDGNATTSATKVDLSGNIMALVDDARGEAETIPCNYCFYNLFHDETAIVNVEKTFLPCTNITNGCYATMFSGCSSIVTVPDLPATTLKDNCYSRMFNGCSSLVTPQELNSTSLAEGCYSSMFSDCTGLKSTPILPATTAMKRCYHMMFDGCTGLNDNTAVIGYVYLESLATESCLQMFAGISQSSEATRRFWSQEADGWNAMFVCPAYGDSTNPTLGMFDWETREDGYTPTQGQTWYFHGTVVTKE